MSSWKVTQQASIYFITSTIVDWYPVFTNSTYFDIIINSLQYCCANKSLQIHAYVIMLNHIHLVASVEDDDSKKLSEVMRDFKRFTSNEISEKLERDRKKSVLKLFATAANNDSKGNNFKVWQDGFHPKAITKEHFGLQKIDYIHQNPVQKGYVARPEYWYYLSAGYYSGSVNYPLEVETLI